MFNGSRLRLARCRSKLTQRQLAQAAGLSSVSVNLYESRSQEPESDNLQRLASILNYPVDFFYGDDLDEALEGMASFRSLSGMLAREKHAALAASSLGFVLSDWLESMFELPNVDTFRFGNESPEVAARALRQRWGLGERPISNMVHLLEAKGFRVFSLSEDTRNVDAFSLWRRDKPFLFLNTKKTAEHSRFDAAHELGHLVIHRHGAPSGRPAEAEANAFASSFLMPESDVRAELPRVYSLDQLVKAKVRWRVSVAALNHRLHKIGVTTSWQYRTFCIQLSERGRDYEPQSVPRELSTVWQRVLAELRSDKLTKHDIAKRAGIPLHEFEQLVFGLATMFSIDGEGALKKPRKPGQLRLV